MNPAPCVIYNSFAELLASEDSPDVSSARGAEPTRVKGAEQAVYAINPNPCKTCRWHSNLPPLCNVSTHHSHFSSFPLLLSRVHRPVIKCSCPSSHPNGSWCNTAFLRPAAWAPLAWGTGIRKADACLCLFFTHSCCFMVFFVVKGSAGSRNNLPALGKEMYPLAFLALAGNALLLPPPCRRGRASPNSPKVSRVLAASKLCLADSDTTSRLHCQSSCWLVTSSHKPGNPRLRNWLESHWYYSRQGFCPKSVVVRFLGV